MLPFPAPRWYYRFFARIPIDEKWDRYIFSILTDFFEKKKFWPLTYIVDFVFSKSSLFLLPSYFEENMSEIVEFLIFDH